MTWLKLSDDFHDELARFGISDEAFRTHVEALIWAMRRENGGSIDRTDIRRFAESEKVEAAIAELLDKKVWTYDENHQRFQLIVGMEHQPTPAQIKARRAGNAVRKQEERERERKRTERKVDASNKSQQDTSPSSP
ncbi:MAG: hypothetical protein GKR84_03465 [Candidatus Nanopelagicales bacterium]|nr:hypothetical protein [Candidatus Nanopelagicales bacterium]